MDKYKAIDEKITEGYRHIERHDTTKACDIWLDAWEDIKSVMKEEDIADITALDDKFNWNEFLSNYVQDLELELGNAGQDNENYIRRRISYCEEMLQLCRNDDTLIIENTRRAIADSHYELGNATECDRLYSAWLEADPKWGWGYIGWSDCYSFGTRKISPNYEKAETIIRKALEQKDVDERIEVIYRAMDIYAALEQTEKVESLKDELTELNKNATRGTTVNTPVKVDKVGRNDPCPCGSGKKYKKCCGA